MSDQLAEDELADELQTRGGGRLQQLVPVEDPAEELRPEPVALGALEDDEGRAVQNDRNAGKVQITAGGAGQSLEHVAPVLAVLQRAAGDYEVVAALQTRVVVVEVRLRQGFASEGAQRGQILAVVVDPDFRRQQRAAEQEEEPRAAAPVQDRDGGAFPARERQGVRVAEDDALVLDAGDGVAEGCRGREADRPRTGDRRCVGGQLHPVRLHHRVLSPPSDGGVRAPARPALRHVLPLPEPGYDATELAPRPVLRDREEPHRPAIRRP